MILRLTAAQAGELAALAEAAYPREACALLVGDESLRVAEIVPAANLATTPEREFELDPAVHVAVMRRLRETNETNRKIVGPRIIGHWHSHPNGRAEPSAQDAAMIYDRSLVWLISAVQDGRAGAPQAFLPDAAATGFTPLPLEINAQD
jgi:proteasome lid subunit RPN8/RPN11